MVSNNPTSEPSDYRHMYDFVDLRNNKPCKRDYKKGTLMGVITNNPDFSIFSSIVEKASYGGRLSDEQSDYTIFVPSDSKLREKYSIEYLDNIDNGTAKQILSFSMMNRKIDKSLLQSSPVSIFPTMNRSNYMNIRTSLGITHLTKSTTVIHWNHPADNGIVHVIDSLLIPENSTC